ncbi:MAG: hypothetical protein C0514_08015 [Candidatus Puniceispirillum sp.]|nr:hypothetical protein [Candidatus Puniceispirillum sp.]
MTSISSVNGPMAYVPGGQNVKVLPEERVIPNPEKQDMSVQSLATTAQKRVQEVPVSVQQKKDIPAESASILEDGTKVAYPEEGKLETGLVYENGQFVQEQRDPKTGEVLGQVPKKSCGAYEEMSKTKYAADEGSIKIAI